MHGFMFSPLLSHPRRCETVSHYEFARGVLVLFGRKNLDTFFSLGPIKKTSFSLRAPKSQSYSLSFFILLKKGKEVKFLVLFFIDFEKLIEKLETIISNFLGLCGLLIHDQNHSSSLCG